VLIADTLREGSYCFLRFAIPLRYSAGFCVYTLKGMPHSYESVHLILHLAGRRIRECLILGGLKVG